MKRNKLPSCIVFCLWSYDIGSIDKELDKNLIISQTLNYGDWKGVQWLFRTYSKGEIREVVADPRRGIWFAHVLNFWCQFFKIKLPKDVRERALFRVGPAEDMNIYKKIFD